MKNQKTAFAVAICCLGSLAATNVVQAGFTTLGISYYSNFGESVRQGTTTHNTYATAFAATRTAGDQLPTGHPDPFITFCLSINGSLASGQTWESGGFSDIPLATDGLRLTDSLYRAANLYSHYAAGILPAGGWGSATTAQKIEGGALQLAIWEVLYEAHGNGTHGGYDVLTMAVNNTTGFKVISTGGNNDLINARANVMLENWSAINENIETTFWNAPAGNQDLIGPMAPVPEPATFIAGGLLLLPFLASTLRRKVRS